MLQTNEEKIRNVKDLLSELINKEEWQKALVIGEYLASLDPEEIFAYRALGLSSLELHDLDQSEKYFLTALECGDADPTTFLLMARINSYRGDLNREIFWLEKAIEQDPDNPRALFTLALTRMTLGENEKAEVILKSVLTSHPAHTPSQRALADIYLLAQDLDKAEEQLREAIRIRNNDPQLLHDLGYILKRRKNYPEALSLHFLALEFSPNKFEQYSEIGDTFMALGEPENAILYLRKASQLDPFNPLVCYNLGRAYFELGRYEQSEAASKAALQHDPEMEHARTNIGLNATLYTGLANLNCGKLIEAEQWFRKNLVLTAPSYHNLGRSLLRQGKYEEALQSFLRAVDLVPENAVYWDLVGNAYLELNQLDDAQKVLEKAIELDPAWSLSHYDLGVVYSRMKGRENDAMKLFKQAISLEPEGALPYYSISCLYALQNKRKPALDYLRKAILRGFNDREHLDNDTDFDLLKDDEEFQKIIRKMVPC
jgi:tetratricopeptide (TPR) repeat protein